MTAETNTLLNALETATMVEIDGLHAFEFELDEQDNLHIDCMDGRERKHWQFTMVEILDATFDETLHSWLITGTSGEHRLVCMDAFSGSNDEDDKDEDA